MELNNLILGRNTLAKWYKRNNKHINLTTYDEFLAKNKTSDESKGASNDIEDLSKYETMKITHYPPMINKPGEC